MSRLHARSNRTKFLYDAEGRRTRVVDRSDPRHHTRHLVADDFDWDATYELAQTHITIAGAWVASQAEPFVPADATAAGPVRGPPGNDVLLAVAATPAAIALLLLALQLVVLRRRGERLSRPALAGSLCVLFYLSLVTPSLAQIPDGDLNEDENLDAADVLLSLRIATGALLPTPEQQSRGDVAPLEIAPDGTLDLADALLILRAARGEDVDTDGLLTDVELAAGASPFRADTDDDGLTDFAEVTLHGTDPAETDTDQDGFPDAEEIASHTNPTEADTDGDGLEDGDDPAPREGVAYQHTDHLGSTVIQLAPDGTVVRRLIYRPFGQAVAPGPGSTAKVPVFGFTGQRFEEGLGLYDYDARWYDPELGRFLQPDSLVPDLFDPQSLNRYSYVRNNPLSRIDPTGSLDFDASDGDDSDGDDSDGDAGGGDPGSIPDFGVGGGEGPGADYQPTLVDQIYWKTDGGIDLSGGGWGDGGSGDGGSSASLAGVSFTSRSDSRGALANAAVLVGAGLGIAFPEISVPAITAGGILFMVVWGAPHGDVLQLQSGDTGKDGLTNEERSTLRDFVKDINNDNPNPPPGNDPPPPPGLMPDLIKRAIKISERAIARGRDKAGVQASRIARLQRALEKLGP